MTWLRALAADALAQVRGELGEVLVGHGDREPVRPGFGEHVFQRVGQVEEVLALVDVQAGVRARGLGQPGAPGGGLPGAGDDERADELRGLLAEDALGQPCQAQPAVVEDLAHVEGGRAGRDRLLGEPAEQERAELVHQRPDRSPP